MQPVVDGLPSVAGASLLLVMLNISSVSSSLSSSGSLVSIASIAAAVAAVNWAEKDGVVCVSNRDVTAARANGIDVLGEGLDPPGHRDGYGGPGHGEGVGGDDGVVGVAHRHRVGPGVGDDTARHLQDSLATRDPGSVEELRPGVEQAVDVIEPGGVEVVDLVAQLDVGLQHPGAVEDPHPAGGDLSQPTASTYQQHS